MKNLLNASLMASLAMMQPDKGTIGEPPISKPDHLASCHNCRLGCDGGCTGSCTRSCQGRSR